MIKRVTFVGKYKRFVVELDNPDKSSGLIIVGIDGLGPAKGTVVVRDYASTDGGAYGTSRVDKRNIVLSLIFDDRCDVEGIRNSLYSCFKVKETVRVGVETDRRFVFIDGYIESIEPTIFSSMEGAKVSIICPDPFWNMAQRDNDWNMEQKLVETLLPNISLKTVRNPGDIACGLIATFTATGSVSKPALTVNGRGVQIDQSLAAGQSLILNTNYGNKSVILRSQNNNPTNLFDITKLTRRTGTTTTVSGQSVRVVGDGSIIYQAATSPALPLGKGKTYTLSGTITKQTGSCALTIISSSGLITWTSGWNNVGDNSITFTIPDDLQYYVGLYVSGSTATAGDCTFSNIKLTEVAPFNDENILHKFVKNGEWPELVPGDNTLRLGASSGSGNMTCTVTFAPRYEGL